MKKAGKILLGLSAIFAAGTIVGALYAPDKGDRTRRRITRKGRGLLNSFNDSLEEGKDTLEAIKDNLQEQLEQINDRIELQGNCKK